MGALRQGRQDQRHPDLRDQRQALRQGRPQPARAGRRGRRGSVRQEGGHLSAPGPKRRGVLAGALALALTATGAGAAGTADDMALGARGAPVTVIEYASLGCPHCAVWAKEVFPAFKAQVHRHRQGPLRLPRNALRRSRPGGRRVPDRALRRPGQVFPGGRRRLPGPGEDRRRRRPGGNPAAHRQGRGLERGAVHGLPQGPGRSDGAAGARVERLCPSRTGSPARRPSWSTAQAGRRAEPWASSTPPSPPPAPKEAGGRAVQFQRLRLSGFKSFVDPTEFRIEPGLTGVVGPNGCGKSNLLEALRWVMGANSAKAMRGGGMDDVIFAGSGARPSRNHAEVTLTIDNADRAAPAAFNDHPVLEVVRRIDRGEGSTYRINGREVRARDVQLLFADASTGANSPALVRQGQISELIAAKPQNRRRILEEAAGVSGLHTRRHEAELRLRAAEANLARLDDVAASWRPISPACAARRARRNATRTCRPRSARCRAPCSTPAGPRPATRWSGWRPRPARAAARRGPRAPAAAATRGRRRRGGDQAPARGGGGRRRHASPAGHREGPPGPRGRERRRRGRPPRRRDRPHRRRRRPRGPDRRRRRPGAGAPGRRDRRGRDRDRRRAAARAGAGGRRQAAEAARAAADAEVEALAAQAAADEARRRAAEARVEEAQGRLARTLRALAQAQAERAALGPAADPRAGRGPRRRPGGRRRRPGRRPRGAGGRRGRSAPPPPPPRPRPARPPAQAEDELGRLKTEARGLAQLAAPAAKAAIPRRWTPWPRRAGYEAALAAALGDDLDAALDRRAPAFWGGARGRGPGMAGGRDAPGALVKAPPALAARLAFTALVERAEGDALQATSRPAPGWSPGRATSGAGTASPRGPRRPSPPPSGWSRRPGWPRSRPRSRLTPQAAGAQGRCRPPPPPACGRPRRPCAPPAESPGEAEARGRPGPRGRERLERDGRPPRRPRPVPRTTPSPASRPSAEASGRLAAARRDAAADRRDDDLAEPLATARAAPDRPRGRRRRALGPGPRGPRARRPPGPAGSPQARPRRLVRRAAAAAAARTRPGHGRAKAEPALAAARDAPEPPWRPAAPRCSTNWPSPRRAAPSPPTPWPPPRPPGPRPTAPPAPPRPPPPRPASRAPASPARLDGRPRAPGRSRRRHPRAAPAWSPRRWPKAGRGGRRHPRRRRRGRGPPLPAWSASATPSARSTCAPRKRRASWPRAWKTLRTERADLTGAIARLRQGIDELNAEGRERLLAAFEVINGHFRTLFTTLFDGGQAELRLVEIRRSPWRPAWRSTPARRASGWRP